MIKSILKSGLGTAVGNAISMPFNIMGMYAQSAMNKDLMNHQQKLNLQSFQHQVASTSIGAQVKRLQALGLNPALALGSGVGSMSGQVGSTSLSGVSPSTPYVMSPAEVSQIENIDANTSKTNEETIRLKTENLYAAQQEVANLEVKKSEILERLSKVGANNALKAQLEKSVQQIDQDIAESRKRIDKIDAEIAELGTRSSLNTAKATESGTQSELNKANTLNVQTQTKREENKLAFENKFNGAPIELLRSLPGASAFIAYAVTNEVENGVEGLRDFVVDAKNNPRKFPDPVGDFVRKNWPKLRDWLNSMDKKFTNGRAKPL